MNRRSFLKRAAGAVLGVLAAVYRVPLDESPVPQLPETLEGWRVIHEYETGIAGGRYLNVLGPVIVTDCFPPRIPSNP